MPKLVQNIRIFTEKSSYPTVQTLAIPRLNNIHRWLIKNFATMIFSLKRFSISIDERVLPIFSGGGGAQLFVATLVALSPGEGGILVHSYDIACHIVCVCVCVCVVGIL